MEDIRKEIEHDDANDDANMVFYKSIGVTLFVMFCVVLSASVVDEGTTNVVNESVENRVVLLNTVEDIGTQGEGITKIYVDTKTGVQYIWHSEKGDSGITVMVDKDGKPLIAEQPEGKVE